MNSNIIEAYEDLFNNYRQIHKDEYIAKESLQNTITSILLRPSLGRSMDSPKRFMRAMARTASRNIVRGRREGQWLFFSSETPVNSYTDEGEPLSVYESYLESNDYGQIDSIENKMHLQDILRYLGDDVFFFMEHIEFPSRGRLRGATGISNRPKIFDSSKEKDRFNYLRSKIRKKYGRLP